MSGNLAKKARRKLDFIANSAEFSAPPERRREVTFSGLGERGVLKNSRHHLFQLARPPQTEITAFKPFRVEYCHDRSFLGMAALDRSRGIGSVSRALVEAECRLGAQAGKGQQPRVIDLARVGSGFYLRFSGAPKCEHYPCIDLARLRRSRMLKPGAVGAGLAAVEGIPACGRGSTCGYRP
jgi:hypothetical protein